MAKSKKTRPQTSLLGQNLRMLRPKLRTIANGDANVNALRAEMSAAVKVTNTRLLDKIPMSTDCSLR